MEKGSNFKVVIRVRPPLPRELNGEKPFQNVVYVEESEKAIVVSETLSVSENSASSDIAPGSFASHKFTFDHVYDQDRTQEEVFNTTAKSVVESSLEGYNATIFAYGQTGTGKTFTMEGFNSGGSIEDRGIIPRSIEQVFQHIQTHLSSSLRFLVRASYLQIYNESISDLLKPERNNLSIREDKKRGVFVEGISEWVVRSPEEIYGLMERGGAMRATGSTKMNEISSRSHAVFVIIVEQSQTSYTDRKGSSISLDDVTNMMATHGRNTDTVSKLNAMVHQSFKVGKLNLVDLAGSERVRLSGATGQRLEESKKINQSLSALGNVIAALTDSKGRGHIPYRDSKLTRILEDSLGGNCKTTMMAMISPALEAMAESISTLKFANRAKNITNKAKVNEDLDQKSLLRKYERELKRLRSELEERSKTVVDKRRLLELDEQRRRAEQDKMAAIRALEERSVEFMKEKEEKKRLEERIAILNSQMLMGSEGNSSNLQTTTDGINEHPAFRVAVKKHQDMIRKEYECKLADLEKERESIEEEKAQVDRYKQLLLKQRDIMIALTQRLNERDEQIMALQDELDAYDHHQKELEEKLDEKTAQLIHLQRVTIEHNANSPAKNADLVQALGDWGGNRLSLESQPNKLFMSYKQFLPYQQEQVVYNESNGKEETILFSAEEKIKELTELLQLSQAENTKMNKELEEFQADKVSMEYLLREKLEKLVQKEIEARMESQAESTHREEESLRRYIQQLEGENAMLKSRDGSFNEEASQLSKRCTTLVKERRAVQTIMEKKIKALVTAVAQAANSTLERVGGIENTGDAGKWLLREVTALQKLVNASITALRNATDADGGHPDVATSEVQAPTFVGHFHPSIRPSLMGSSMAKLPPTSAFVKPISNEQFTRDYGGISVQELIQQRKEQLRKEAER